MQPDDARRIVHAGLLVTVLCLLAATVVLRRRGRISRSQAWWTGVSATLVALAEVVALLG